MVTDDKGDQTTPVLSSESSMKSKTKINCCTWNSKQVHLSASIGCRCNQPSGYVEELKAFLVHRASSAYLEEKAENEDPRISEAVAYISGKYISHHAVPLYAVHNDRTRLSLVFLRFYSCWHPIKISRSCHFSCVLGTIND